MACLLFILGVVSFSLFVVWSSSNESVVSASLSVCFFGLFPNTSKLSHTRVDNKTDGQPSYNPRHSNYNVNWGQALTGHNLTVTRIDLLQYIGLLSKTLLLLLALLAQGWWGFTQQALPGSYTKTIWSLAHGLRILLAKAACCRFLSNTGKRIQISWGTSIDAIHLV